MPDLCVKMSGSFQARRIGNYVYNTGAIPAGYVKGVLRITLDVDVADKDVLLTPVGDVIGGLSIVSLTKTDAPDA